MGGCIYFIFYLNALGRQSGVNVLVGLREPMLEVSPPLEVAQLLVVAPLEVSPPLEVAPLTRSRGLSVFQVCVQLGLGCKRGGYSGGVEADWGISWVCWAKPSMPDHA